jgi:glycosyltransferase involved in cell wall biosynthesis
MEIDRASPRPGITIIVPTFNSQACVTRCLRSILDQSYRNLEVVVVDGLSTDGTMAEVRRVAVADSRVRYLSEPDRGVYDAMNKGVKLASGEWLLFLGSDDSLHTEDTLEEIVRHLRSRYDLVYGNVMIHGNVDWAKDQQIYGGKFDRTRIVRRNISHQCIFYHRRVFERFGGYNLKYRVCADWEFNARIFLRTRKHYVDVIVADFTAGGLSSQEADDPLYADLVPLFTRYLRLSPFNSFYRERQAELEALVRQLKQMRAYPQLAYYGFVWLLHAPGRLRRLTRVVRQAMASA